ncbi:MAG: glucose 1-dehydrogenase [Candidatus Levybacteria bacterium]|nr:glucose 1-dehydrogenase [Candidatus Levybacteria bacterium]
MRLENKVAIVTGGGSGIGQAIAILFAKEGAKVVAAGRRIEALQSTVAEIVRQRRISLGLKKSGGEALAVTADVSSFSSIQNLIQKTLEKFGRIDILVNNAGIYLAGDAVSTTEEDWDKVLAIDAKGTFLCSKAALPSMIKQGKGKIVNTASIAGWIGFEESIAYCAAKGAVVNMTREMALDFGPKNINVNAIAPGVVETDMTQSFLQDENAKKSFLDKIPIGRIGKPLDIAYAALYLASDESDFVTGETLIVDGGWTAR